MKHYLKVQKEYYDALERGDKRFEIRKNDRNFKKDDELYLYEINGKNATGRSLDFVVTDIFYGPGFGLRRGYCVMSLLMECSYDRVHRAEPYDEEAKGERLHTS